MECLARVGELTDFLRHCIQAFREARVALARGGNELFCELTQGAGGDISIGADLLCEKIFIKHLSSFGTIYSEESGEIECTNADNREFEIFLDPLDGSNNFKAQIPYYGVSIHRRSRIDKTHKESLVANFCNGEVFISNNNRSFRTNEQDFAKEYKLTPLVFSQQLCTNIGVFEGVYKHSKMAVLLQKNAIKFRSLGALAVSLALSYRLRFVLYLGILRDYDILAGLHISSGLKHYVGPNALCVANDDATYSLLLKLIKDYQET